MDVAKRVLQWRLLIIDEISIVSSKLFAEIDVKMRNAVREIGTKKLDATLTERPFGGLNVLCCGDFWQLDPPGGGFLAGIPTDFAQVASTNQHLLLLMDKLCSGVALAMAFKESLSYGNVKDVTTSG